MKAAVFIYILFSFLTGFVRCADVDSLMEKHLKKEDIPVSRDNYYLFRENSLWQKNQDFNEQYEKVNPEEKNDRYSWGGYLDFEHGTSLSDRYGRYGDGNMKMLTTRFLAEFRHVSDFVELFASLDSRFTRQNVRYNDPYSDDKVELHEVYAFFPSASGWQVKIGRQRYNWGIMDMLSPADIFPEYGLYPLWDRNERKIPRWGLKIEKRILLWDMEILAVPGFKEEDAANGALFETFIHKKIMDYYASSAVLVEEEDYSKNRVEDGTYGFQLSGDILGWKSAVRYASWLALEPVIYRQKKAADNSGMPAQILIRHERNMQLSASFERQFSTTIYGKAETAYNFNTFREKEEPQTGFSAFDDSVESLHNWFSVFGIEKKFREQFNADVFFYTNAFFNKSDLNSYDYTNGITFRLYGNILIPKLSYSVRGIRQFFDQMYVNPEFKYRFNEKFSAQFGWHLFDAHSEEMILGQFQHDDQVYFGSRFTF